MRSVNFNRRAFFGICVLAGGMCAPACHADDTPPVPVPIPLEEGIASAPGAETLIEDVHAGRLEQVEQQLRGGIDANSISENGYSCLQVATIAGQPSMLQLLLDFGADVDLSPQSVSPLIYAAAQNRLACARVLLDAGADTRFQVSSGKTALHLAALQGNAEMVELLMQYGARPTPPLKQPGLASQIADPQQADRIMQLLTNRRETTAVDATGAILVKDSDDLQTKLLSATDGAIFRLSPGHYDGPIVIDGIQVTIVGAPQDRSTTLQNTAPDAQYVVWVRAGGGLTLRDVRLQCDGEQQVGIWLADSQATVQQCQFGDAPFFACYAKNSQLNLDQCDFENLTSLGVVAQEKSKVLIQRCGFQKGNRTAVQLESQSDAEIVECEFKEFAESGIRGIGAGDVQVNDCQFFDCEISIAAHNRCNSLSVRDSRFVGNSTSVLAQDVDQYTRLANNHVDQAQGSGTAFDIQRLGGAVIRDNLVRGGDLGIYVGSQFPSPVAINRNRIVGTQTGGIYISAQTQAGSVARLSRNWIASPTGYGIVADSSSPTTLSSNTIVCQDKMAVSLQRRSTAVLNGNDIYAAEGAVSFFEPDGQQSLLVNEQVFGAAAATLAQHLTTDSTDRLLQSAQDRRLQSEVGSLVASVMQVASANPANSDDLQRALGKLADRFSTNRAAAEKLLRLTLRIEDDAGLRRETSFSVYRSASAAAGMQHYVASDIRDPDDLLTFLQDKNSAVGHRCRFAHPGLDAAAEQEHDSVQDVVLNELNRLVDDPELYERSRFEPLLDPQSLSAMDARVIKPEEIQVLRSRNRRLLDAVLANLVRSSRRVGKSSDQPVYVPPGQYWIVPDIQENLLRSCSVAGEQDANILIRVPQSVWLPIETSAKGPPTWDLFQLRSPAQLRAELARIRPRASESTRALRELRYHLRPDGVPQTRNEARALAIDYLPSLLIDPAKAEKLKPSLTGLEYLDAQMYVQRILSVVGTGEDAATIAEGIPDMGDLTQQHRWMAVITRIEARQGNLETGWCSQLASNSNRQIAVVAAMQLHQCGISRFDDVLRDYLQYPQNTQLARDAAYALLDDDDGSTRFAMLSFHNHLLLQQDDDPALRLSELVVPSSLYLLAYGQPSDLRYVSSTPWSAAGLYYLSALTSSPLRPVKHLLGANQWIYDARTLGAALVTRPDGPALDHQLRAMIVRKEQSRFQSPYDQMGAGFRSNQEAELVGAFYRPSARVVQLLGGFDEGSIDLTARADILPTLQSKLRWFPGRDQLDMYVRNWQAGNATYLQKLDHFTIDEIEAAIERCGGSKPAALDLFRSAHAISSQIGTHALRHFSTGLDERCYLFFQSMDEDFDVGGVNGLVELRIENKEQKTQFFIRLRQAAYYNRSTLIDGELESLYPFHKYVKEDGRALIDSVSVRRDGQRTAVRELQKQPDGSFVFEADLDAPAGSEGYLDIHFKFFDQETTMTFALHQGENARRIRAEPAR